MNTRLQVEHPVTELVTGLDLVNIQLQVASGLPLPFTQADVRATGHAVECRVYAEDARTLLPQAGRLLLYREPATSGVRVDAGVVSGQTVTVHYDPLLAKVIAHGATRDEAIESLYRALGEYDVLGLRHNISFLRGLLQRPEVRSNGVYTRFIEDHLVELQAPPTRATTEAAAAMAAYVAGRTSAPAELDSQDGDEDLERDPWALLGPVT